jgi:DNA-binding CsgD family transcriptional regulator
VNWNEADPGLVGREEELSLVERALSSGHYGGIVLMGAPGVGKSRLAREVIGRGAGTRAADAGVWVSGTRSASGVPFGAFAHLLPALDGPGVDRLAVMIAARRAVLTRAGESSSLLVVDDAHLLDEASAALVHQLTMSRALRVVITVRSGELAPDAVVALWKDGWLECLDLQPLDRVALGELVAALLGGRVDSRTVARVWEQTRGNALFCRELVRAAVAAGQLSREDGMWRWRGGLPGIGRIWDLIDGRLAELGEEELAALEVAAVADGADVALFDAVVDARARVGLARRGLVILHTDAGRPVLRLAHPVFGEAVRARMPEARRADVCGRLADAAQQRGLASGPELLRVARWRLEHPDSGDRALFLAAARRAQAGFDPDLAERFARAAIACEGGFDADHALAIALGARGEVAAAQEIFARLEREATEDAQRATVAAQWSEMLFLNGGRSADAAAVAGRAVRRLKTGWLRDELRVLEASWAWLSGESTLLDRVDEWLEIGEQSERMGMLVAFAIAPRQVVAGRIGEALAILDRSAPAAARWREALPTVELALRATRAYALWSAGRLSDDLEYSEREWAVAVDAGELEPTAMFAFCRGGALTDIGRIDTAIAALREGLVLFEELGTPLYVSWSLAFLARALALAGDASTARETLERARQTRPAQIRLMEPELGSAEVWVTVAEGDVRGARELALEVAARDAVAGRIVAAGRALHDVVRLGDPGRVARQLEGLAAVTDAPAIAVFAAHAAALAASDARGLAGAGQRFDRLGCALWAAEAYASAALAFESGGRAASARTAGARAGALLARCESARTPALAGTSAGASLTPRERDVALLAARGLPNREIARRLVVSVRTIESHLAQTYRKLGVKDRSELAEMLAAGAPGPLVTEAVRSRSSEASVAVHR